MTPLSWYPRPNPDTGLGFHDSANLGASPSDIAAHARVLRENGITWYKILEGGGNKVERCRVYLQHGIMPIVRLYQPRPHPDYTVYPGQVAQYVAAGVRYFEFGNEPNISPDEWAPGKWPSAADMGAIIARQWLAGADMIKREGGIPLMFAMTPGGTYDHAGGHRRITRDMLQYLKDHNALGSFDRAGVAIHPRPHNNPPDVPHSATNTVTWDEYRWYINTYREFLGWCPPMFATEHGYSIGDAQNTDYPRIDEHLWTDYNQELFERMNPNHPKRIEQEVFALLYWGETEMGTWHNDRVSDGWFPGGVRRWGQRLLDMNVNWNRTVSDVPPTEPEPNVRIIDMGSTHSSSRAGHRVKKVIVHSTVTPLNGSLESTARYLVRNERQVSIHELVGANTVYRMVPDSLAAHHAWSETVNIPGVPRNLANLETWGIEGLQYATHPTAPDVVQLMVERVALACKRHNLTAADVLSHGEVDPGRRSDPVGVDMNGFRGRVAALLAPAPAPVPVPEPAPPVEPLPEHEQPATLAEWLGKMAWWAEEQERQYQAREFLRASQIRQSMMRALAWGRDKWGKAA